MNADLSPVKLWRPFALAFAAGGKESANFAAVSALFLE